MSKPVKVEILVGTDNLTKGLEAATVKSELLEGSLKRLQGVVGGVFTVHAALRFVDAVREVRSEIESLSVSFETLLGDQHRAQAFFSQLAEYKLSTPFSLNDIAKSAQVLLGFNVPEDNILNVIRQLSDISMANVERFKSLTLAYAQTATAGRLMGQDLLQMVNAGFNPLMEISKTTGESLVQLRKEMELGAISSEMVAQAYEQATARGGRFHNMIERQSKTMKGMTSNLKGAIDMMLNEIGAANQGVFSDAIDAATFLIKHYEAIGKALMALISTYGAYKAAVIAVTLVERASAITQNIRLIAMLRKEIGLLTAAQQAFNLTSKANPYVLLGTAILSLISYTVIYGNKVKGMQVELDRVNEREKEFADLQREKKSAVEDAIRVLKNENAIQEERVAAVRMLKDLMPEVFSQYETEEELLTNLTRVREEYNQALRDEKTLKDIENVHDDKQRLKELKQYKALLDKQAKGGRLVPFDRHRLDALEAKYLTQVNEARDHWYSSTRNGLENLIKGTSATVEAGVSAIRTSQHDKFVARLSSMNKAQIDATVDMYKEIFSRTKEEGKEFVQIAGETVEIPIDDVAHRLETAQRRASYLAENATKDFLADAKKNWQAAKAKITEIIKNKDDRSLYPDEAAYRAAIAAARKAEEEAKGTYELYGGDTKERKKRIDDYDREIREQKDHIIDENKKAELEIRAASIEAQEDGIEKEMKTIELNYDRLLEENRKRRREYVRQLQKLSDAEYYKANPLAKEKGVKPPTVTEADLSVDQLNNLKAYEDAANKYKAGAETKLFRSLIDKYKDYEDQRTALLLTAEQERKAIRKSGMKDEEKAASGAKLDRFVKVQLRQINEAQINDIKKDNSVLVSLFADTSEKSIREIQAIIDKVSLLMSYLEAVKNEEGTAILQDGTEITQKDMANLGFSPADLAALASSPQKLKELIEAIKKMKKEVAGRSPFTSFADSMREGLDLLSDGKAEQGLNKIQKSIEGILPTVSELGESLGAVFGKEAQDGIAATVEMLGVLATGAIGIGKVAAGDVSGVLDVAKSVGYLFTKANEAAREHHEAMQKIMSQTIAQQREYNLLLMEQQLIYREGATIFGEDAYGKAQNALKVAKEANAAFMSAIRGSEDQQRKYGRTSWHGNEVYAYNEKMAKNAGLADIRIKTDRSKGTIWNLWKSVDIYDSLLKVYPDLVDAQGNFNKELAQSILATREFEREGKDALEGVIKLYEQQEKALEEVKDHLSSIFGELGSDITNALVEAFRDVSDASKKLVDTISGMLEQLVNQMVYSVSIAPLVKEAQEEMLKVQKDSTLTPEKRIESYTKVLAELMDSVLGKQDEVNALLSNAKKIAEERGLKIYNKDEGEEQQGRAGAFVAATQDVMLKIEGLFTAMLIREASIQSGVENIAVALSSALTHLKRIDDHTGASSETLKEIAREIKIMKDDVGSIKRDGLKTK